ncbi:MAG: hypothetical protein JSV61_13915 [Anaerolineales bacterium]|nr:MAG: hypothetical protein JSV61_13915 [Anaerolineales bacterium]
MEEQNNKKPRRRGSLFWPLILIALGIFLLLDNIGVLQGNTWATVVSLWPLLLIVIGLDGIYKREGLVGATFLIGLGVIFLLANFGFLAVNVWRMVIYLWPVLLIAFGFDLVIGRRSMLASFIGLVLILGILAGSLWFFGVRVERGQGLAGETISQALNGATGAHIAIEAGAGEVLLSASESENTLISGRVSRQGTMRLEESSSQSGGVADYTLRAVGPSIPGRFNTDWGWNLEITKEVPVDLEVSLGAGNLELDLAGVNLSDIDADLGVGMLTIQFPDAGSYNANINGAIGSIILEIPRDYGVSIQYDTALVGAEVPSDYRRRDGMYYSPNYDSALDKIDISLDLAIGSWSIEEGR